MKKCAFKSCASTETERLYLNNHSSSSLIEPTLLIIEVCAHCKQKIRNEYLKYNYYGGRNSGIIYEVPQPKNNEFCNEE